MVCILRCLYRGSRIDESAVTLGKGLNNGFEEIPTLFIALAKL